MLAAGDSLYKLLRDGNFSDFAAATGDVAIRILVVVVVAFVVAHLGSRAARRSVESLVARSTLPGTRVRGAGRARTLGGVAASMVRGVVWTVAVLLVLDDFGLNLGPLLAGASIIGVALGFGAQSLVKDFLSGFFILAEDQYGVGDVITVSNTTGTVEEVNLRVTRMRSYDGTVWFVPNGEIRKVGNSHKEWARAIVDILVSPGADLGAACASITRELEEVANDEHLSASLLEPPEVLGVEAMGVDGATIRVAAKTDPSDRARVSREIRSRILVRLREEGIVTASETTQPGAPPPSPTTS